MSKKGKSIPPQIPNPRNDNDELEKTKTFDVVSKRNRWLGIGIMAGLIGIIVMLGYHSSNVKSELAKTEDAKKKIVEAFEKSKQEFLGKNETNSAEKAALEESKEALEAEIAKLESSLRNVKSRVGDLRDEKRDAERELGQFKRVSKQFQRMINSGKLEVDFRHGRMVVNLPAQVLFDSGSAELTEEGLKALREVAKVLRKVKNKRFVVGGHTDNRKIRKASFDSNWELASARAIGVTKALIKSGLPPSNLIAAGYSQYSPIASNSTEAGRQKNRRIEIILEPYLKDISLPSRKNKATAAKSKKKKSKATASKSEPVVKKTESAKRKADLRSGKRKTAQRRANQKKSTKV